MATGNDKNVGIVIDLLVDAEQFVNNVQQSLNTGKNLIKKQSAEMKQALDEVFKLKGVDQEVIKRFSSLRDIVTRTAKDFAQATKGGQDLSAGLLNIKNNANEVTAAWERISAAQKTSKQSATEVARRLMSTGEIEASVAQQALNNNGKRLLSNDQLLSGQRRLQEEAIKTGNAFKTAFNLDDEIAGAIAQLNTLSQKLNANQIQLGNLTSGQGFKANALAAKVDPKAATMIEERATAFGTSKTTAGLELIKSGDLNIEQMLGGLRKLADGSEALIPTYKQLNDAINVQRTAYDALLKSVTEVVVAQRKEQVQQANVAEAAAKTTAELKKQEEADAKLAKKEAELARLLKAERDVMQQTVTTLINMNAELAGTTVRSTVFGSKIEQNRKALENLKNSTLGWAEASKRAATDVGDKFAKTGMIIQELSSRMGISQTQAAQVALSTGLVELGNAQGYLATQGEKLIMSETQATAAMKVQEQQLKNGKQSVLSYADALQKIKMKQDELSGKPLKMDISKTFKGVFDQITNVIGKFLLFQYVLQGVTQSFNEINEKFLEFDRNLFSLDTIVNSARKSIGEAAGTTDEWLASIQRLRNEFPQFSQKDVTGAVTSVGKLTSTLGFTREEIEAVIREAAKLSQVAGTDLFSAADDIVKALGGSSVVLDKYNVLIRDADKNQTQFAKTIGKTTATMTSQELALATLEAVTRQVDQLTSTMGDYSQTASGQVAVANAKVEDTMVAIGEQTINIDIYFKNLWADFLVGVQNALPFFETLLSTIKDINEEVAKRAKTESIIEQERISPFNKFQIRANKSDAEMEYELSKTTRGKELKALQFDNVDMAEYNKFLEEENKLEELISTALQKGEDAGVWRNQLEALRRRIRGVVGTSSEGDLRQTWEFMESSEMFIQRLFPNLKGPEFDAMLAEFRQDYITALNKLAAITYVENEKRPGQTAFLPEVSEFVLTDEEQKALDKAKEDAADAGIDKNRNITEAEMKFNDDIRKIALDRDEAFADLEKSTQSDKDKAGRKATDDEAKALLNYQRNLANLEEKAREDREIKNKEFQDKSEEAWRDYYRDLELLDKEYLMDLRDAVADNDAVAIKRLERKYNLDKTKINQKLQDRLEDEEKAREKSIKKIDQETEDRKKELELRYRQELEDIKIALDIEIREIDIAKKEEEEKIDESWKRRKSALETNLATEKAQINLHYDEQIEDIGRKLRRSGEITAEHYQAVFDEMSKYLGKDGDYIKLINGFYDEEMRIKNNRANDYSIYDPAFQSWLKDEYGITIPDKWKPTATSTPAPQPRGYMTPDAGIDQTQAPIRVEFSSDGTIPEQFYEIISERTINEISTTIGGMVAR